MSDLSGVSYKQRTAAAITGGRVSGACEHCPWISDEAYPDNREGQPQAAADARMHLATDHPEMVVYWDLI